MKFEFHFKKLLALYNPKGNKNKQVFKEEKKKIFECKIGLPKKGKDSMRMEMRAAKGTKKMNWKK